MRMKISKPTTPGQTAPRRPGLHKGKLDQEPPSKPEPSFLNEETIKCEICFEIMFNPMNVANCNHKFCAACALKWAEERNYCAKCRKPIGRMSKDLFAQQIVEQYLKQYPERIRTEDERKRANMLELDCLEKKVREAQMDSSESSYSSDEDDFGNYYHRHLVDNGVIYHHHRHRSNSFLSEYNVRINQIRLELGLSPRRYPRNRQLPNIRRIPTRTARRSIVPARPRITNGRVVRRGRP